MTHPDPRRRAEDELRSLARQYVREGVLMPEEMQRELASAIEFELPGTDPAILARAWLAAEQAALRATPGASGPSGRAGA